MTTRWVGGRVGWCVGWSVWVSVVVVGVGWLTVHDSKLSRRDAKNFALRVPCKYSDT